jgi:hypothetical protein
MMTELLAQTTQPKTEVPVPQSTGVYWWGFGIAVVVIIAVAVWWWKKRP